MFPCVDSAFDMGGRVYIATSSCAVEVVLLCMFEISLEIVMGWRVKLARLLLYMIALDWNVLCD